MRALKVITTRIAKTKKATKILSSNEENLCNCSNECHICEKDFNEYSDENYKVKDYCYYTGTYRGAAHKECSNKYNEERDIPIVFHNASSYDYHFIIRELA